MNRRKFLGSAFALGVSGLWVPAIPPFQRTRFIPVAKKVIPASGGAAWTPASDSNLLYWYKAYEGVTYDGSNLVSQVNDNKGTFHLTAAGDARPTRSPSGLNGHDTIIHNGSSQYLLNVDTTLTDGGKTFYGIFRCVASVSNRYIFSTRFEQYSLVQSSVPALKLSIGGSQPGQYAEITDNTWYVVVFQFNTGSSKIIVNGTSTNIIGGTQYAATRLSLGADIDGANLANIEWLEFCFSDTVHDSTAITNYQNYLKFASGLSW